MRAVRPSSPTRPSGRAATVARDGSSRSVPRPGSGRRRPGGSPCRDSAPAHPDAGPGPAPTPAGSPARPTAPRRAPRTCTSRPRSPPPRRTSAPAAAPAPACVLARGDLRRAEREGREGNLVLFVVDASGSMAARKRMTAVTGAVLGLLRDAYQRRDKVGLVTFRAAGAELALPPTSSVPTAQARLPGCAPAAAPRWRTGCCAPARCWPSSGCATRSAARCSCCSPTAGRPSPPGPARDPVDDARRAAGLLAADGVAHRRRRLRVRPGPARPGRPARRRRRGTGRHARRAVRRRRRRRRPRRPRRLRECGRARHERRPMPQGQARPSRTTG